MRQAPSSSGESNGMITILAIQSGLATLAYLFGTSLDPVAISAATAVGGVILLGVAFRPPAED